MTRPTRAQEIAERDGIGRCTFCRERVLWAYPVPNPRARTDAGRFPKPMPLNYEPDPRGRFVLYRDGEDDMVGELTRGQVAGWRAAGKPTYQRHYATWPKKAEWGKRGIYTYRDISR
jgi:hypothetical protein